MALSWGRNKSNAIDFSPAISDVIIRPDIIEPLYPIRTSKQEQLVIETDNGMIRSRRGNLTCRRSTFVTVRDEHFPLVRRVLELVQVECNQIIEEEAFYLSSEYVEFGA